MTPKPASSALTIVQTEEGILPAAHLINALNVTSVISACNCSLYIESCLLLFMCRAGKAPGLLVVPIRREHREWADLYKNVCLHCFLGAIVKCQRGVLSSDNTIQRRALVAQGQVASKTNHTRLLSNRGAPTCPLQPMSFPRFLSGTQLFLNPYSAKGFVVNYTWFLLSQFHHSSLILAQNELDQSSRYGHLKRKKRFRGIED
ncbi:hypothetical protein N7523_007488 [Penicillium sp. IBT 18751x]|nr:hypothetical protein N7523_007488 [Penicillium sp. IBT 18751x]